ncbi:DUF2147 domain-containing protein [Sphingobium sp.]|uniref:DUF2147 domain-containing protein n=1 Tax=Sphingobium sp. TaxID=1912891 RepID=UPI0029C09078|nr:DUF2147 domain-containing protein [Sphingobium sp.]
MKKFVAYWVAGVFAGIAGHGTGYSEPPDQSFGTWRNPKNSVHIRAHPCGSEMCGTVIWANAKAQADARKGGTEKLIGAQLFRNFRQERQGVWRGKVLVPDIGKTFTGTVTMVNATTAEGKGCLVGKIGCKSQTWTRIPD